MTHFQFLAAEWSDVFESASKAEALAILDPARKQRPAAELSFDEQSLPRTVPVSVQTLDQLKRFETQLHEKDEKLSVLLADKDKLDDELKRLRKEVADAKKASESIPDNHNYSETETRDYFIDLLLKEAGWPLDQNRDREFPVTGMPNNNGEGFADYVLWGDDGKPLGIVEAKRTKRSPKEGEHQAKLYADCLEAMFDQRPVIFYSNGYEHWIWDDQNYPPRQVQGFYKKAELELLIQRRTTRRCRREHADLAAQRLQCRSVGVPAIRRSGGHRASDPVHDALSV